MPNLLIGTQFQHNLQKHLQEQLYKFKQEEKSQAQMRGMNGHSTSIRRPHLSHSISEERDDETDTSSNDTSNCNKQVSPGIRIVDRKRSESGPATQVIESIKVIESMLG